MEASDWRHYRRHLIIARKRGLFGGRRFEVWDQGSRIGSFRSVVHAELHVDARIAGT